MASKRPQLIPVYDQYVAKALLEDPTENDWLAWQDRLSGPSGEALRDEVAALVQATDQDQQVSPAWQHSISVLRVLDIVVWMRVHGWKFAPSLTDELSSKPSFWAR